MDGAQEETAKWRPLKQRLASLWDRGAGADPAGQIPDWKLRLIAWWDGNEVDKPRATPVKIKRRRAKFEPELRESCLAPHIECKNFVWGEGFTSPGDAAYCCDLLRPTGLTSEYRRLQYMLDLGAGLGGPARAFAREFGVWVAGMELDRELATAGMELSVAAGMARKAPISVFNPKTTEIPERKFDCIFSKETLFLIAEKRALMRKIERGLKSGGHLMFTDYVAADGAIGKPALQQWIDSEPRIPHLITAAEFTDILTETGLELRVARDITDDFGGMLTKSWNNWKEIVETVDKHVSRDALMQELAKEVQLWTIRQQAIQSGDFKVFSFHATKRAAAATEDICKNDEKPSR